MRKLVVWAALAGAVIGMVFLGAEGTAFTLGTSPDTVTYTGDYVPLRDVESTDFDPLLGSRLSWWNQTRIPWWSYPLIGAASGAVLAAPCALAGVRVTRVRR